MGKLRFTIAYDGTDFHGWQTQAGVTTVQETLETILRRVAAAPINLVGASRTDSGVHARGQVAHAQYAGPVPADNIRRATNTRLDDAILLVDVRPVPESFHATRGAIEKLYRYRIWNAPDRPNPPWLARTHWHVRFPLDVDALRDAGRRMIGTRDFNGFASQGSPRASTVRTVSRVAIRQQGAEIVIDVRGDGFLYNQVRNMVGTLIEIGRGHWQAAQIDRILTTCDRRDAGPTAPPHGLCLEWVRYPPIHEWLP